MAVYGDHLTLKLADRVQQHVRGSLRTSARSRLAERADHRPGELEGVGPRTSDDGWPTGLEQRIHRRGGLPRPVKLLADFGRGDLGRLPDQPAAVHVHIQAALLEPVNVLGESLRFVQYLGDLAQGHRRKPGRLARRAGSPCSWWCVAGSRCPGQLTAGQRTSPSSQVTTGGLNPAWMRRVAVGPTGATGWRDSTAGPGSYPADRSSSACTARN